MTDKNKKPKRKRALPINTKIRIFFVLGVAIVLLASELIISVIEFVCTRTGLITVEMLEETSAGIVFMWSAVSLIMGLIFAVIVSRIMLRPATKLIDGLSKLSQGEYSTRIEYKDNSAMATVYESFNNLAKELQKTEILRSDFVNNFSHEFKTPISSINGLITLMKKGRISPEKQREYLDVITEEIRRLSEMTTNVLNLAKYENQGILTDKVKFNLSEQIRECVLVLERRWRDKKLVLSLDFDEYTLIGNEGMLHQVWMNLLSNAVKFANVGGLLAVRIKREEENIIVEVENSGSFIAKEDLQRIFNKVYQTDNSHAKEGNGIGLSIVRSIVLLHGGVVSASSNEDGTVFTVVLPDRTND